MPLDEYQEQVVNSNDRRILCLAGAGSGKTSTLISRIDHLINSGISSTQILALTFTNAAAVEMRQRFEITHPGRLIPEFRTFHSFSYKLICCDYNIRNALGYTKIPEIASAEFEKEITERAKTQCKIKLSSDQLKYRKNLSRKEQWQAELYDKAFARLMKQEDMITFDMLNSEMSQLFDADHPSTLQYKMQYKYIFVDEYQDTDSIQVKFLESFKSSNLYVCGDTLQGIYAFRGCSNKYIKKYSNSTDWTKYRLQNNYRSTKQICDFANKFSATYADESYRIPMHSTKMGEDVVVRTICSPENMEAIDANAIDDIIDDLSQLSGTSAILCRTNKEVSAVSSYLTAKSISHTTKHGTKIPKLIECALSDKYMISYLASYLSSDKYGEYIRLTTNKDPDIKWFLSVYGNNSKIDAESKKIMKLREISILLISSADKIREIDKFLKISIPVPENDELYGEEFLKYLQTASEEIKSNELYVGTIHSVKGLEYDNVCVANVNSYCFKLGDEDMNNLFYVAITRAKNRLFVYMI